MPVKVIIPSQLRGYTSGRAEVTAEGGTLGLVLDDLERQFPGFRFRVIDEQNRVRRHILLFVGEQRHEDLSITVPAGVAVQIVGALSGG